MECIARLSELAADLQRSDPMSVHGQGNLGCALLMAKYVGMKINGLRMLTSSSWRHWARLQDGKIPSDASAVMRTNGYRTSKT